jgi:16S rRNA (uracil1498-N3)-methyltransferase
MPATPAWPPASTPRLFVETLLAEGAELRIDGNAAHYLGNVMRVSPGDPILLFDDQSGEWLARVAHRGKRDLVVRVEAQTRPHETVPDLWLCIAPIKKGRIDWVIEKATELGIAQVLPVLTARTIVDRINADRLRAHAIEAAEQCGRTALPAIAEPQRLAALLRDWPGERALYFADEAGGGDAAAAMTRRSPAAILIGPEGGFTDEERSLIHACTAAVPISLGPRILRAETAAVAAVSVWMAATGAWRAGDD